MNRKTSLVAEKKERIQYEWNVSEKGKAMVYTPLSKKDMDDKIRYIMCEVNELPYNIPVAYSLEQELNILSDVSLRAYKIRKRMSRTDMEAIASDWIKVGKAINESIRKYSMQ